MSIRANYDRLADAYDRRWARYNRRSLALLRPWLASRDVGRVVDVGCGTGNLLPLLAGCGARTGGYVGVDLSTGMMRVARGKAGAAAAPAAFVAGDACALPLRAASFDTAVSASALHDWDDAEGGLREVRRVLRPGGRLLLLDWRRDPLPMRLLDAGMRIAGVEYRRMYASAELRRMLEAAGFRIEAEARGSAGGPWRLAAFQALAR